MGRTSIRDLLQKPTTISKEEKELQLALDLSAKEQVNEQKRLLEQFSKQCKKPVVTRKQRIITQDTDQDNDLWFQTVSTRPQISRMANRTKPAVKAKPVTDKAKPVTDKAKPVTDKARPTHSTMLPNTLNPVKKESVQIQFDLDSILRESSDEEDDTHNANQFDLDRVNVEQMIDSDSDSSIIDLVNIAADIEPTREDAAAVVVDDEEDDGYLSPLEGFESIENTNNPFVEHLTPNVKRKRAPRATSTTKKPYKRKNKWGRKKKKMNKD